VFLSPNVFIVQSTSFTVQPESQRHKRLVIGYDIDGFLILQEHAPLDQGRVLNPPTYPPTPDEQKVIAWQKGYLQQLTGASFDHGYWTRVPGTGDVTWVQLRPYSATDANQVWSLMPGPVPGPSDPSRGNDPSRGGGPDFGGTLTLIVNPDGILATRAQVLTHRREGEKLEVVNTNIQTVTADTQLLNTNGVPASGLFYFEHA
jgi:hypothetical protein